LTVQYAVGEIARKCLERMIDHITGNAKEEIKKKGKINISQPNYCPIYLFAVWV
jgi:hypothetical protein